MTTTISIDLSSVKSIRNAKKQLERYRKELNKKCEKVVKRLAEIGIKTAKLNCGEYGNVITFSKEVAGSNTGATGRIVAVGRPVIRVRGNTTFEVDPLLMAEFGSGWEARVLDNVGGVGQGTFPSQTHAFDPNGWWYTDENGVSHHSYGETPTHPMHSAMMAIIFEVNGVLREVFGNG